VEWLRGVRGEMRPHNEAATERSRPEGALDSLRT